MANYFLNNQFFVNLLLVLAINKQGLSFLE